jgi:formate dehydrogenase gamma subunit
MAVATRPPETVTRFDRVERVLHWVNAGLFLVLIATGACLYLPTLSALVGRRPLVADIHLYCGLALPVPVIVAVAGRWGRGLRDDFRRLNRWSADDRQWLRWSLSGRPDRDRMRAALEVGKFNPGQKLNAAFVAGSIVVLLGTGVILRWYGVWPLAWRTGATSVHDWLALAVVVVVAGHVAFALRHPAALRSMVTGTVTRAWARRHAPAWLEEAGGQPPAASPE